MSAKSSITIGELVPKLKGSSNWRTWYERMKGYMLTHDKNVWKFFTGDLTRPENVDESNEEEVVAAVVKLQEECDKKSALRAATALLTGKPDVSHAKIKVNNDILFGTIEQTQTEWDLLDLTAITYVQATVTAGMAVYILPGASAKQVHDRRKKVCGTPSSEEAAQRFHKLVQYVYKGSKPKVFIQKWRQYLQDFRETFPEDEKISYFMDFQFLHEAISGVKECDAFLTTYRRDPKESWEQNFETFTSAFIAYELRRLSRNASAPIQQPAANSATTNTGGGKKKKALPR